jgi:O-antigen ligase
VSAATARLPELRQVAGAIVFVLAVAIGGLAGLDPKFAIAAALGLAFVLVAVSNLAVGVSIFGLLAFLELAPAVGGPALSFAKLAGLTLAISWVAVIATEPDRDRLIFGRHSALIGFAVLFVLWSALSVTWAEDPAEAVSSAQRYGLNVLLIPIVYTAIYRPQHVRWLAGCLVAGAAAAAVYGLVTIPSAAGAADSVTAAGDLNRITGTVGDPNLLASVLIVGLILALALALDGKRAALGRVACAGVAFICFVAVVATVSRGGIIALAAALVATVLFAGKRRGRAAVGVLIFAALAIGYFSAFATDAQQARLETADGGSGRTDIWKVGWRMVEDKPGHGVGAGNFNVSSIHYLLVEPGAVERSDFIVDTPAVAHNVYLEILAELGIPGLAMFLLVVVASIAASVRAANAFDRLGEDGLALIARGVAIAMCSVLASDFFLAAGYSKLLWILISFGPALLGVARRMDTGDAQTRPA